MARYLGNSNEMEVHDTLHERPGCAIARVKAWHRVNFFPDTLEEAGRQGYSSCDYCIVYAE